MAEVNRDKRLSEMSGNDANGLTRLVGITEGLFELQANESKTVDIKRIYGILLCADRTQTYMPAVFVVSDSGVQKVNNEAYFSRDSEDNKVTVSMSENKLKFENRFNRLARIDFRIL